ncbi:MAG: hypothetical protein ACJAVA_000338 [Flavobacteriaceae bacterium]|jgi:hypothetical protein
MESKQVKPKKNKVTKKLQKFIDSISNIVDTTGVGLEEAPQSYVSKIDGSYLTFVGLENNLKFLLKNGITENVTSNLGFNPIEQKWYGWSHRAIFGFGIRSQCKKGDCGYRVGSEGEFIKSEKDNILNKNTHNVEVSRKGDILTVVSIFKGYKEDLSQDKFIGEKSIQSYRIEKGGYSVIVETVKCGPEPCPDLAYEKANPISHEYTSDHSCTYIEAEPMYYFHPYGKGEWTARTLDEAKEMALDFAKGVS